MTEKKQTEGKKTGGATETKDKKSECGIIMPISSCAEYTAEHWCEVYEIITNSVEDVGLNPLRVNTDKYDAVGLIHERIVENLYDNEIVICDVSSKNPNVMFELGLRLAFDKPTIIIKDDRTEYSFDTGVIEHIEYPKSLHFQSIVNFKDKLADKINGTLEKAKKTNYSPFLQSFGKRIKPAKINETEVSESKFLLEELRSLSFDVKKMQRYLFSNEHKFISNKRRFSGHYLEELLEKNYAFILKKYGEIDPNTLFDETRREMASLGIEIGDGALFIAASKFIKNKDVN